MGIMGLIGDTFKGLTWPGAKIGHAVGLGRKPPNTQLDHGGYVTQTAQDQIGQIFGRQAPQADPTRVGNVNTYSTAPTLGNQDAIRQRQLGLADQVAAIANGTRQGAGELAARRQGQAALGQIQGAATMARGAGAVGGARAAARQTGAVGLGVAGQAQQAAMQDQQGAQGMLAQLYGQTRDQDLGAAGLQQQAGLANMTAQNQAIFQQAGLNQSTSLANMQARLQATGMNDQAALAYLSQIYNVDAAQLQARMAAETGRNQMLGSAMQVAGGIAAASV